MEVTSYEKAFEADSSAAAVDVRAIQEANQFVAMGILISRGASDTEDVVGVLAGNSAALTFNLKVGEVHKLRFSSISSQADGTTTQQVLIVGV